MPDALRCTLAATALLLACCDREPDAAWRTPDAAGRGAALPEGIEPADGLVVEGFAQDPLLRNPVAIDLDDRGRLYVVETHRYRRSVFDITMHPSWLRDDLALRTVADREAFLLRTFADTPETLTADSELVRLVVDDDGDGRADRSTVFADGFDAVVAGTAAGVLPVDDDVWFACVPDLWRFEGGTEQDVVERGTRVATGFGVHVGVTGHDLHGFALGIDGRLYFSVGDRGAHVRVGGRTIDLPDTGAVFRCELDGSGLEVFATGLRNPQELAFDDEGHLFTADNDTAGDDRSRVLHVVQDGDYGWRMSYQHQEGFGPWVQEKVWEGGIDGTLPGAGYVAQGPAGLACHPGTGFAPGQRGRFFVCDFPQGVLSFAVRPRGATFVTEDVQRVLWNLWPTDLAFGPDGALWVSDWVAGWGLPERGRVYRVFDAATLESDEVERTRRTLAEGFEHRGENELLDLLGAPDRRVRLGAQRALVRRGSAAGALTVLRDAELDRVRRLHALWVVACSARAGRADAAPLVDFTSDPDAVIREHALRACGDVGIGGAAAVARLGDDDARVLFAAALAVAADPTEPGFAPLLAMIAADGERDPFLLHAGVEALRTVATPARIGALADHEQRDVRRAALLALRREGAAEIARFLADEDEALRTEAARAIHDVPIDAARPALAELVGESILPAAARSRAIASALAVGRPEDAERIAASASDASRDPATRALALRALARWAEPDPVDLIVGLWRPIGARDAEPARAALARVAGDIARDAREPEVVDALVEAVRELRVDDAADALSSLVGDVRRTPSLRAAALRGLAGIGEGEAMADAMAAALGDEAPEPRAAAIELWPEFDPSTATARCASFAREDPDVRVRRAAIRALGELSDAESAADLLALLRELDGMDPALHLDVLESARRRDDPALRAALAEREARLDPTDPLARWRPTLHGGDPESGRRIFEQRADVQCQRCHAVAGVGGNVGPALDAVGRQDPALILESVILPAARITEGYPPAMPPVAAELLTLAELRDLVAWLKTLK